MWALVNINKIIQPEGTNLDKQSGRQRGERKKPGLWYHTGHFHVILGKLLELIPLWNVGIISIT